MPIGARHTEPPLLCFLEIDDVLRAVPRDSYAAPAEAFARLEASNIAPVVCSGGTRAELGYLLRAMDVWQPFIAEDGSAICIPRGYFGDTHSPAGVDASYEVVEFGSAHHTVSKIISTVAERLNLEILRLTNCSLATAIVTFGFAPPVARRARQRLYGEVLRLRDANEFALARLERALRREHLRCTRRGTNIYVVPDCCGRLATASLQRMFEHHVAGVRTVGFIGSEEAGIVASDVDPVIRLTAPTLADVAHIIVQAATRIRSRGRASPTVG